MEKLHGGRHQRRCSDCTMDLSQIARAKQLGKLLCAKDRMDGRFARDTSRGSPQGAKTGTRSNGRDRTPFFLVFSGHSKHPHDLKSWHRPQSTTSTPCHRRLERTTTFMSQSIDAASQRGPIITEGAGSKQVDMGKRTRVVDEAILDQSSIGPCTCGSPCEFLDACTANEKHAQYSGPFQGAVHCQRAYFKFKPPRPRSQVGPESQP